MEELIDLPDGKYVMPIGLYNRTKFAVIRRTYSGNKQVRCTVVNGVLVQFNTSDLERWYEEHPEGIRLSKGFTFVYTAEDLNTLVNSLPYSWRS